MLHGKMIVTNTAVYVYNKIKLYDTAVIMNTGLFSLSNLDTLTNEYSDICKYFKYMQQAV